jgi:hypothetical protein
VEVKEYSVIASQYSGVAIHSFAFLRRTMPLCVRQKAKPTSLSFRAEGEESVFNSPPSLRACIQAWQSIFFVFSFVSLPTLFLGATFFSERK